MGLWNLYFAAKLYLFSLGKLQVIWLLNILFAIALLVPLHLRWLRITRNVLAALAGIALFYHESGWPPISRAISQIPVLLTFTPSYMLELLGRLVSLKAIIAAVLAVLLYFLINRWIRVTTIVLIALVGVPLYQGAGTLVANATSALAQNGGDGGGSDSEGRNANEPRNEQAGGYDQQLAAFRANEEGRRVNFTPITSDASAQFDIIVVHICSLSWDDMDVVKMRNNPLFSRFDYIFQNFSSGASYSGPAAIRVLRATCGQEPHKGLYDPAPPECHLFAQLAAAGFTPNALLNHNGRFDDFRGTVIKEIGVPGVTIPSNEGLPVFMKEFDNSDLVDDYDVIARWYKQRIAAGGGPAALYYNTVSMHDGNRLPNTKLTSLESYPIRLQTLLGDVDKLINLVAQSGRKAVIVFVPEHGAALRGEENQIAGMREIPTPHIVHVPVGVKVVGLPAGTGQAGGPVTIDQPTSYLALAQLLANLVAKSPFAAGAQPLAQYAQNLPQTRMVGENEGTVTMTTPTGYVIHTPDGVWVEGK